MIDLHKHWQKKCVDAGTNLTALCKEAGISRNTVEYWKTGKGASTSTIAKLEQALERLRRNQTV